MLKRQGPGFHFRRIVPEPLRRLVGQREFWSALGTSSPTVARARAGRLYAKSEEILTLARSIADSLPPMVPANFDDPEAELRALDAAIVEDLEATLEIERRKSALRESILEMRLLSEQARQHEELRGRIEGANAKLAAALPIVERARGTVAEARRSGEQSRQIAADLAATATALRSSIVAVPKGPPKPRLSLLLDDFFVARRTVDRATHQVMGQDRGTIRRFLESAGDLPVDAYGRAHVTAFLDILRKLPAVYGRSPKDKDASLENLVLRAEASGEKRLSDKTVKRHLSALSQLFGHAVDKGHITTTIRGELFDDHRFRTETSARDQRDAWTPDELTALFKSPVWSGRHPYFVAQAGTEIIRDAKFWLPLLALFHGGRLEEFADLYRRDVIRDGATWAVEIQRTDGDDAASAKDGSAGGKKERRLKTRNSKRTIPLHPEILRLGFLAHVKRTAPGRDDPLFPDIEPQGRDGKRGARITRWFVEYRRQIGLYRAGVGMHSFRHVANTRLRDSITEYQQVRQLNYLLGHSSGGGEGAERYDKGPGLAKVAATLALLEIPEVDLRHLYEG